jgi:hypothetical protein
MTSGYSGTPLLKKLGLKPGFTRHVINAPATYIEWLGELPMEAGFDVASKSFDSVHWFVTSAEELSRDLEAVAGRLKNSGMLWVSWPKGTSSIPTDINRDMIRTYLLQNSDLVDIKVCAVSEDWSGLKFMIRKEKRNPN